MVFRSAFLIVFFFFFQAEDGIRDKLVTGETCALPILMARSVRRFITVRIYDCIRFRSNATIVYFLADIREESIYGSYASCWLEGTPFQFAVDETHQRHSERENRARSKCKQDWPVPTTLMPELADPVRGDSGADRAQHETQPRQR